MDLFVGGEDKNFILVYLLFDGWLKLFITLHTWMIVSVSMLKNMVMVWWSVLLDMA
jgi:hypothetical protein